MRRFVCAVFYFVLFLWPLAVTAGDVMYCALCGGGGCPRCQAAAQPTATQPSSLGGDSQQDAFHPPLPQGNNGTATTQFLVQGGKWPQGPLGSPVTITYSYHNLLNGGLLDPEGNSIPADYIRTVVEEALGLWASVAPLHFVEVEDEGGPVIFGNYPDGQFGQIRFAHRFINGPDPPACFEPGADPRACGASAKAQAFFPGGGTTTSAGDVFYDNGDRWRVDGTLAEPDLLGATVHELGHSLGLGHTGVADANMYWVFTRFGGPGTGALHPDDIAGIRQVYGPGVGSVTALPEPTALAAIATLCLWFASTRKRHSPRMAAGSR